MAEWSIYQTGAPIFSSLYLKNLCTLMDHIDFSTFHSFPLIEQTARFYADPTPTEVSLPLVTFRGLWFLTE